MGVLLFLDHYPLLLKGFSLWIYFSIGLKQTKVWATKRVSPKFTNDDIQVLLDISNTSAGRYLQELEDSGKITHHSNIGTGVYYAKN